MAATGSVDFQLVHCYAGPLVESASIRDPDNPIRGPCPAGKFMATILPDGSVTSTRLPPRGAPATAIASLRDASGSGNPYLFMPDDGGNRCDNEPSCWWCHTPRFARGVLCKCFERLTDRYSSVICLRYLDRRFMPDMVDARAANTRKRVGKGVRGVAVEQVCR